MALGTYLPSFKNRILGQKAAARKIESNREKKGHGSSCFLWGRTSTLRQFRWLCQAFIFDQWTNWPGRARQCQRLLWGMASAVWCHVVWVL